MKKRIILILLLVGFFIPSLGVLAASRRQEQLLGGVFGTTTVFGWMNDNYYVNKLFVGDVPSPVDPNVGLYAVANTNTYYALNVANRSTGNRSSVDVVAYNDSANSYVDMGMQGTGNTDPAYATFGAGSAYVYSALSDLYLGSAGTSAADGNTYIFSGGTDSKDKIRATFSYDGKLGIGTTTPQESIHAIGNSIFTGWMTAGQSQNTYYVATTGTDAGLCLVASSPCKTLQYAINKDTSFFNNVSSTIVLQPGTYAENVIMPTYGSGKINIVGLGATPDDTILTAATVAGTAFSHKNNRWTVVMNNLSFNSSAIDVDLDNTNYEYNDVHFTYSSRGITFTNYSIVVNNSGSPTFTGTGAASQGLTGTAQSSITTLTKNTFVGNNVGIFLSSGVSSFFWGWDMTMRTGSLFAVAVRSNSNIGGSGSAGHTFDVVFPTVTANSIAIQLSNSNASWIAGSIFNTTNAYYRTEMDGYSFWNEGNTCTFNDTGVTIKAYLNWPGAAFSSQNYLGTGSVYGVTYFSSFAGAFPTVFSGDVKYPLQIVNNSTASSTINATIGTEYVDATSGNIVKTLPSATTFYAKMLWFIKKDSSANTVTITPNGANTIGGFSNYVLSKQGDSVMIQSDGVNTWIIVSKIGGAPSSNYDIFAVSSTLNYSQYYIEATTAGTVYTLPTAVGNKGRGFEIDNASIGDITVITTLGQTINGLTSQIVPPDSNMKIISNGTNWRIK